MNILIPSTVAMLARVWTLADGPSISIVKGLLATGGPANASTDELLYIPIADITETEIEQYLVGAYFLPIMVAPMIPPAAEEGAG